MKIRRRGAAAVAIAVAVACSVSACTSSGGPGEIVGSGSDALPPRTPAAPSSLPAAPTTQAPATGSAGGTGDFDGSYSGWVYPPGFQPDQGMQLTFTVSNGQVHDWLGYQVGTCTSVTEEDYIKGPVTINNGVLSADVKTDVPNSGGEYTNSYVQGVFDGTRASGTVDYTAVGPCVEAQQRWVAMRSGG